MKKILSTLLIIGIATWGYFAFKEHQIAQEIEKQLHSRMDRDFNVTKVNKVVYKSGEIYEATIKMEGIQKPFEIWFPTIAVDSLYEYAVISELWNRQYEKEVKEIIKQHPFKIQKVEGNVGIKTDEEINIRHVPNIQQVRKKYGEGAMIDNIYRGKYTLSN